LTFLFADASIATNESYRKVAIERGRMDPDHAFIVRSAPDLSRFQACEPVASYKEGKPFLVGYVGVMGEQEGVDLLLQAAHHLIRQCGRSDVQFCLVGGGPSLESLRRLSEQMGLSDNVKFLGRVPDRTLLEVLSTSDICVNPDRVNPFNAQSTMNKIMEYMALAKPIVQFDMTEGRVSAGASSLYAKANDPVDLAQCIDTLLDDPERRARMGKIGQLRLERRLGWDRQIPELIRAYETALGLQEVHSPQDVVGTWSVAKASNSNHRRAG
jgi:glycosyltransferase involved in cell wall biosynthesis